MAKKDITKKKSSGEQIRCVWGLLCSMSSIDQERNNISLFNVINQLNIPSTNFEQAKKQGKEGLIVSHPHEITLYYRRILQTELCDEECIAETTVALIDPSGTTLYEVLQPIKFEAGKRGLYFRARQDAFKITAPGDYVYRIGIRQSQAEQPIKAFEIPLQVSSV